MKLGGCEAKRAPRPRVTAPNGRARVRAARGRGAEGVAVALGGSDVVQSRMEVTQKAAVARLSNLTSARALVE